MGNYKNFRSFLASEKKLIDPMPIKWITDKRPPKTGQNSFPLSRAKAVRVGSCWRWTMLRINADNVEHKLMIAYYPDKMQLSAVLGRKLENDDHLILARLEYHPSHPGIHIHGCCVDVPPSSFGRLKYEQQKRFPASPNNRHRVQIFTPNDENILNLVGTHFRIDELKIKSNQIDFGW